MKLLIIVLCIVSERYLVHTMSHFRFHWFNTYFNAIQSRLPQTGLLTNPFVALGLTVLPILLITALIFLLVDTIAFGFLGLILTLLIFYYCLGPGNPFYPVSSPDAALESEEVAGAYLAQVNNQLFAVIFWFIVTGPLGVLFYRLVNLCQHYELTKTAADSIVEGLDWVSARVTLLLYLLVGNFQRGFHYYTQQFLASPKNNETILSTGGLLVAQTQDGDVVTLPNAQNLVEHALILYLVFLAFFTLVAWL